MRRFIAPDARPYACRACFLGVLLLASCGGGSSDAPSSSDTTPPSATANLAATAVSTTQVDLTWDAANDNVGVAGYRIERCQGAGCSNFAQIAAPAGTGTLFSDMGLAASTSYSYRVRATDAAANLGPYSNTKSTSTPAPDPTPPSPTTNLAATGVWYAQVDLTWDAATDNVGVTGYRIERCQGASCSNFAQIAAPSGTGTLFSDTAVAASTSYSYRVRATDAAGNLGDFSNTSTALTPAPSTPAALFTDDFDRTNLGGNWLNSGAAGGAIVSDRLTGGGTADNFIFATSVNPPANQYAKIRFVSTDNVTTDVDNGGPMVRANAIGDGWLFDWISNQPTTGQSTWTLFKVVKTVGQLPVAATGTFDRALADGDVIEIRAVGQLITGYLNGIPVPGATTTDATYPTGGFGMHLFHNTGMWDNFEGGSL